MATSRCCLISTVLVSLAAIIFLVIGIAGPLYLNKQLTDGINEEVLITSTDSPNFKNFQSNDRADAAPIFMKFYVWNCTNAQDVLWNGSKPVIQEVGPYSYREYNNYINISWNKDQTRMNWTKWQYFLYSAEDSFEGADPFNDYFTVPNIVMQSILGGLTFNKSYESQWWRTIAYDLVSAYANEQMFINVSANDLIWGYNDTILSILASLTPEAPSTFYVQLNMTDEDEAYKYSKINMVDTGKDDINEIGSYILWHNVTSLNCWGTPEANVVVGNDATQFRPGVKKGDLPKVWVEQLFRYVEVKGTGDGHVKGIYVLEFTIPAEGYLNATTYPPNAAYYQFWQPGIANLTACELGAPAFMSKPHFLDAEYFASQVIGVDPDRSKHDTVIYVEPNVGQSFSAYKRLQLNVRLFPDPLLYPNLNTEYLVPIVWVEEGGEMTDQQAEEFKNSVYRIQNISAFAKWGGLSVGILLAIVATGLGVKTYQLYQKRASGYAPIGINERQHDDD